MAHVHLVSIAFVVSIAASARAQELADPVRLDLVRGPVITSSRIMGLGGAFVGVGEGIDGIFRNPAALANRGPGETSFFAADFTLDWMFVQGGALDWDADTRPLSDDFEFQALNLGLVTQWGPLGLGVLATLYGWSGDGVSIQHVDVLLGAGWAFADGAVIVGAGVTASTLTVKAIDGGADPELLLELSGASGDFGVLWRPPERDWRIGARFRSAAVLTDGGEVSGRSPWQLAVGWSSFYSAERTRRYNPRLRSEVQDPIDRRYLMLSAELVVLEATHGVSLESAVGGLPRQSGRSVSVAVHLGAEGEIIHDFARARVGTYIEPARVVGGPYLRPHITGGIEIHLFELLFDWKANFAFDLAPGWENVTIGLGFWK